MLFLPSQILNIAKNGKEHFVFSVFNGSCSWNCSFISTFALLSRTRPSQSLWITEFWWSRKWSLHFLQSRNRLVIMLDLNCLKKTLQNVPLRVSSYKQSNIQSHFWYSNEAKEACSNSWHFPVFGNTMFVGWFFVIKPGPLIEKFVSIVLELHCLLQKCY